MARPSVGLNLLKSKAELLLFSPDRSKPGEVLLFDSEASLFEQSCILWHSTAPFFCRCASGCLTTGTGFQMHHIWQWEKIWELAYLNCLWLSLQKRGFYSYSCWHVGQRVSGTCLHLVGETLQQIDGRWLRGPYETSSDQSSEATVVPIVPLASCGWW